MAIKKSLTQLSKFMAYVLGIRPDEFGLVPDENGYFKTRDFLKALWEEEGFRHVRRSDIDEILLTISESLFEINDQVIRAVDRKQLPGLIPAHRPPKLLFTCVRRKAHRFTMEKGIFPLGHPMVVLASNTEMAGRIGRRYDKEPVMLTVQVAKSLEHGVVFLQFGQSLFTTDNIPVGCFSGPSLPKEKSFEKKEGTFSEKADQAPGSYFPVFLPQEEQKKLESRKRKKDIAWKKERKRKQRSGEKW